MSFAEESRDGNHREGHVPQASSTRPVTVRASRSPVRKQSCSGRASRLRHAGGVAHKGDFTAQARAAFDAIRKLVEAAGGTLANIVKINTSVTDMRNRPQFRTVRDEVFGVKGPASTLIEVSGLAIRTI